jgi:ferredoxin-thioredoxin reductase catalytic subunit
MNNKEISQEMVNQLYEKLKKEAEASGYHLNPDEEYTRELIKGLLVNENRYGYQACPCRLSSGEKNSDVDIICPCYYRDPDLTEYGSCYCALYVSQLVISESRNISSIPERRLPPEQRGNNSVIDDSILPRLKYPVWRCQVCGYLCARDKPPEVCPVCKAKNERFEQFL